MSGDSFGSIGLHLGAGVHISCSTYPDKPGGQPILSVDAPRLYLALYPAGAAGATEQDVSTARALVDAAGVYLAEIERLFSESTPADAESAA